MALDFLAFVWGSTWVRGPARLEGADVVMDFAVKRREAYSVSDEPDLPFALARVRRPTDVVRFVERFGLLRVGQMYPDDEYVDGMPRNEIPTEVREPFADFDEAASRLREIINIKRVLKRAESEGDPESKEKLRRWVGDLLARAQESHLGEVYGADSAEFRRLSGVFRKGRRRHLEDDAAVLRDAKLALAATLDGAVSRLRLGVAAEKLSGEGALRLVIEGTSLLDFCFLHLLRTFSSNSRLETCPECGGPFSTTDPRKRFCTDTCASKSRYRKWANRREAEHTKKRS